MSKESYLNPPEPEPMPVCPNCGADCLRIYVNIDNQVAGCEECFLDDFTVWDSAEWAAREKENEKAANDDRKYDEWKDGQL